MLITLATMEVDPATIVQVGEYHESEAKPGFFRHRTGRGTLATVDDVPRDQLHALADAMPRPVHLGSDGLRDDWLSADHVAEVRPTVPGEVVFAGDVGDVAAFGEGGELLLVLGLGLGEARALFGLGE